VRITLHRRSRAGGTLLAMFLIVAAVGLLTVGGCVANRVNKKVQNLKERRERQLTNELDEASAGLMRDYVAAGGNPAVLQVGLVMEVPLTNDTTPVITLETTTNLAGWTTVEGGPDALGSVIAVGFTNGEPLRLFRLRSDPTP
jgi:hypothetical protein